MKNLFFIGPILYIASAVISLIFPTAKNNIPRCNGVVVLTGAGYTCSAAEAFDCYTTRNEIVTNSATGENTDPEDTRGSGINIDCI